MPSRNIIKEFAPDNYYHIYSRGVAKRSIFMDARDKRMFLKIVARYLETSKKAKYRAFDTEIELLCFCLMNNHFHLLIYQFENPTAITDFMRRVLTTYTMYFNKRHDRIGPLFQSVYKSSRVSRENYLLHISRYIHMNPRAYKFYAFSSLPYYQGVVCPAWLKPKRILSMFNGDYMEFLNDYEDYKQSLEEIKYEMANS